MTDITIPAAAIEAGARAIAEAKGWTWERIAERLRVCCRAEARAACRAMLTAWPGAYDTEDFYAEKRCFILPLPTEASDDQ